MRLLEEITSRELVADQVARHLEKVGFPIEEVIELLPFDPDVRTAQIAGKLKESADGVILTAKTKDESYYVYSHIDVAPETVVLIAFAQSPLAKKALERHKNVAAAVVIEKDLGLEDDAPVILPEGTPLGVPVTEVLDSTVLDVEITPNRGDLYSVYGLARELSVFFGERFEPPQPPYVEMVSSKHPFRLEIEAEADVTQYYGFVIEGIKVRPSPFWFRWRLHALGARPVNNVVDITNYTMFLTGQPLHAFDASLIGKSVVKVRRASPKETFTAIDHKDYRLSADCLLITDEAHPIALAGVMGGVDSEVSEGATGLFLESAEFTPQAARRTITHTGIQSESGKRFAAGVDGEMVRQAALVFMEILAGFCPDLVVKGELVYGKPQPKDQVSLNYVRLDTYAATETDKVKARSNLELIGFDVETSGDSFKAGVPSHRNDMAEDVDLIEEVLRLSGYDELPSRFTVHSDKPGKINQLSKRINLIRDFLIGLGLQETYTPSLISQSEIPEEFGKYVILLTNPMTERMSVLRPSLLPGLLASAAENVRFGIENLALYEVSQIFRKGKDKPSEPLHLGILLSGQLKPVGWDSKSKLLDFFDLKGIIEMFFARFKIVDVSYELVESGYLDEPRSKTIIGKKEVGVLGRVSSEILKKSNILQEVYFAEIDLTALEAFFGKEALYEPLPRFKTVQRDLALLLDADHNAAEIMQFIRRKAGALCSDVEVFDSFVGPPLEPGKRNLGLRLNFQPRNNNLAKEELDALMKELSKKVASEYNAVVRGREADGC